MLNGPDAVEYITAVVALAFIAVVLAVAWWLRR
jgi:hypothetical protein